MTGIELITQERKEQIKKHGFDVKSDEYYSHNELIKAALFAINPKQFEWPYSWAPEFRDKIINKPNDIERLKIAGALIAAEIDRIQLGIDKYDIIRHNDGEEFPKRKNNGKAKKD